MLSLMWPHSVRIGLDFLWDGQIPGRAGHRVVRGGPSEAHRKLHSRLPPLVRVDFQVLGGAFQAFGWPAIVCVMTNWFGKARSGIIFGFWNANVSVGNILGSVLAG